MILRLLEEILVATATERATSSTRVQSNVVSAHSCLLLNICSTRTTAMRIKIALVARMRSGGTDARREESMEHAICPVGPCMQ